MDNVEARDDREAFIRADVAFHFVFAQMAQNDVFVALHEAMSTWLREQREIALRAQGEIDRACAAHAAILAAVDPPAAQDLLRNQIDPEPPPQGTGEGTVRPPPGQLDHCSTVAP